MDQIIKVKANIKNFKRIEITNNIKLDYLKSIIDKIPAKKLSRKMV